MPKMALSKSPFLSNTECPRAHSRPAPWHRLWCHLAVTVRLKVPHAIREYDEPPKKCLEAEIALPALLEAGLNYANSYCVFASNCLPLHQFHATDAKVMQYMYRGCQYQNVQHSWAKHA